MPSESSVHEHEGPTVDDPDDPNDLNRVLCGRTVVPVVNRNKKLKKDKLGFEYAEHCFIGDAITLTLADGKTVPASSKTFALSDGVILTYGQINGLAGDFYGTYSPISDGKDAKEQSARFYDAYNTLADGGSRQPKEANDILAVLQEEVDAVNKALENHQDPSVVYAQLPNVNFALEKITWGRSGIPGYLGLAQINWDHFGADARTAYNAGHAAALQTAMEGELDEAYAMNAFADHFLEDSFSAGHLRTPRRLLHRSWDKTADWCAKYMHDEDCAIGISVRNPAGESWMVYGDKRALDEADKDNKDRCVDAVQASADEIYAAYHTREAPLPENYKAWSYAPTLESARVVTQSLVTLFNFVGESQRRTEIKNRRLFDFTADWKFGLTATACFVSGWWNYPITIDGPKRILPWSNITATSPEEWSIQMFYQGVDGGILESKHTDGQWTNPPLQSPIFQDAMLFTPLASLTWDDGNQICVYYLDKKSILQECRSSDKGKTWAPGDLGALNFHAAINTSISAVLFSDSGLHIRLYFQDSNSTIQEACHDGDFWTSGATLPVALSGTSISAVTVYSSVREIRVYYQTDSLSLREHCYDQTGWHPGDFNPGRGPGCVPISALAWYNRGSSNFYVYHRDVSKNIVGWKNDDGQWYPTGTVVGDLKAGTKFAVTAFSNGEHLRLYYQDSTDSLVEMLNDNGNGWSKGHIISNT